MDLPLLDPDDYQSADNIENAIIEQKLQKLIYK